jgi:DNA primase
MFTFIEEFEGLDFRQALASLAARAGVPLEAEKPGEREEKQQLFKTVEAAVEIFEKELPHHAPVLEYLAKRGLTKETISSWRIGFAKPEWRALSDELRAQKYSETDMLAVGLIKRSDTDSKQFYDVFRGRIMFPIFDSSGRPVAFSGRIFIDDDKSPKYLNSPATALFNKSEVLYGFDRAKSAIRKLNYSILVEGQMDLIMSHQAGLANTVASSGTALTEQHLRRLMRISPRIMFAFDSDSAGFNATKRSAELALQIGMEVKVAVLPAGDDPASLVVKNPNLWKQALKNGKHIIDFYTDSLIARKLNPRVLSREIKTAVLPFVLRVESKTEQAHFIRSIADKSGLKEDALWDDLKSLSRDPGVGQVRAAGSGAGSSVRAPGVDDKVPLTRRQGIERKILGIILWKRGSNDPVSEVIRERYAQVAPDTPLDTLEAELAAERDKLVFETEQYYGAVDQEARVEQELEELLVNLEEEVLKESFTRKRLEVKKAESEGRHEEAESFLKECQDITRRISALQSKRN